MIILMKIIFTFSLLAIGYHLFIYPLLLRYFSSHHHRIRASNKKYHNYFVFIIPMFNEELFIEKKINNLASLDYPSDKYEIILLNDGSTDNTLRVARAVAKKHPHIHIKIKSYHDNKGKVALYNQIIPDIPENTILFFSDVSALLSKNALKRANIYFNNPKIGAFCTKYLMKKQGLHGEKKYWKYQSTIHYLESHLGSPIGFHGAGYAIRKKLWNPLPNNTINDDFVMSMSVIAKGYSGIYDVKSSCKEQELSSTRIDWNRRIRISKGNIQQVFFLLSLLSPRNGFISWMFLSSKVLRIFLPWFFIFVSISSLILTYYDPLIYGPIIAGQFLIFFLVMINSVHNLKLKSINTISYFFNGQRAALQGWINLSKQGLHWERANTSPKPSYIHPVVRGLKWLFDKIGAIFGILILMVAFPFCAIIIKLSSPGPVLYRQLRVGKSTSRQTNIICVYKFRTMCVDADKSILKYNIKNDPRIFPFGAFLRRTHLDELPQFYNVLKGDMSLIGPRPDKIDFYKHLKSRIPLYDERLHDVLPGMTGLAQVKQGPDLKITDAKKRIYYDYAYAMYMTKPLLWIRLEMFIVIQTIKIILLGKEL